ncbi:MAG: L-threonylcarbamoyladenylate synthase [Firmicutes bacterium]|nr:L-threonylcarbamoyladenylate synthase [Bacillota bacterium]
MTTLRLNASIPADIARAAALLRAGELVAMPTETVYGLAANALAPAAVAKIFAAKGRPQDNPLIVHVAEASQALPLVKAFPFTAQRLADAFWPGPLTFILQREGHVPKIVSAGLSTLALRVPAHPAARALLREANVPLAAPSANRSGSPSPTLASHVLNDLNGKIAAVLDAGPCAVGIESTVLDLTSEIPLLLRPGGISAEQLEKVLGQPVAISPAIAHAIENDAPTPSPGMKYKHYAPRAELTLVQGGLQAFIAYAEQEQPDGLLVFDADVSTVNCQLSTVNCLGYGDSPEEQARRLFARLREIDELGWRTALVRCPAKEGLGLGVYNRLLRASAFREVSV